MSKNAKYICSRCQKEFDDREYSYTQDKSKCILHCKKENWYTIVDNKKDWSQNSNSIKFFWGKIREIIKDRNEDELFKRGAALDLTYIIFPIFEKEYTEVDEDEDGTPHIQYWEGNFLDQNIVLEKSPTYRFDFPLNLSNSIFLDDADFSYYEFHKTTYFDNVYFMGSCNFTHTDFKQVSFKNVTFFNLVFFIYTKLNSYSYKAGDFENSIFHKDVEFYSVTFGEENSTQSFDLEFIKTKFKKVSFNKCIFNKSMSFNQETKLELLKIENANIDKLYINANVPSIFIIGEKHKINKFELAPNELENLLIYNYIVENDFILTDENRGKNEFIELKNLNLSESKFKGKVKIQFYDIEKRSAFYNTKFEDLADFYQTKFRHVVFERTDFKGVSVFSESEFCCNVDFKYTKFLEKSIFRDTIITGKLNLRDSIFNDNANFLDVTSSSRKVFNKKTEKYEFIGDASDIQVANRETARTIKNFFDTKNNIIEANRFYKLEMEEREKEIENNKNNILENIVFKLHSWSSNHSQDWVLALFWIISLTLGGSLISYLNCNINNNIFEKFFSGFIIIGIIFSINVHFVNWKKKISSAIICIYIVLYLFIAKDTSFERFSEIINPFSIMTSKDTLTFGMLLFKTIIAYLIYQFIISLRQNTKRK
ncbi:hypothetical protein [Sulfurimonas sp.]|uniref:hypothetical protein n=1 Tax=Sulfurimonas sp. TaxID=2022749 RepID=UPI0025FDD65B|nr:hypothetical protein [Sulfurimonas sp.]